MTVNYSFDDAGKWAHYAARWINTKGETGPRGETPNRVSNPVRGSIRKPHIPLRSMWG
ncbi:hypothetical protein Barb4_05561 [Bacteroidales bacterium Barb4]|nr:hypothetical protein Barb4_05561 [Bacteroidales bacterium Barb4]